jgi:hypothetical protein
VEPKADIVHPYDGAAAPADSATAVAACKTADAPPLAPFDPVALAARHDGWTPERQRAFIEELADCGIVTEAAARVGMSERTARRLRRRPDAAGFNRAWDEALRIGAERLHTVAWERALPSAAVLLAATRRSFAGKQRFAFHTPRYRNFRTFGTFRASGRSGWEATPGPNDTSAPMWCARDGTWLTNFPPPPGFEGQEWGDWCDANYRRTLGPDEEEKLFAWQERRLAERNRRRERYLDRLG